jgi:hypothetical protein
MGPVGLGQQRRRPVRSARQISDPLRGEKDPLRCGRSTQQGSVPLALASLVLGPRGFFSHFFEVSCRRFEISIRRPEALSPDAKPKVSLQQRSGTPAARWHLLRVPRVDGDYRCIHYRDQDSIEC